MPGKKIINRIGERRGSLIVVEYAGVHQNDHHKHMWRCQCDCGNVITVRWEHLTSGDIVSCGCKRRQSGDQVPMNSYYRKYLAGAAVRGLIFVLTKEQFAILTKQDCYYCGAPPSEKRRSLKRAEPYLANGLDRIDSSKGYTIDNVRPCCTECNMLKGRKTEGEFFAEAERFARWSEKVLARHFRRNIRVA